MCPGRIIFVIERFGRNVCAVGPANRVTTLICGHCREELRVVANRFKDGTPEVRLEVNLAFGVVGENDADTEPIQGFDGANADQFGIFGMSNDRGSTTFNRGDIKLSAGMRVFG